MAVESLKEVVKLWETGKITIEQCLGKILLLLLEHNTRLLKLEATSRKRDDKDLNK
jgi:hypothetical protein